VKMLTRQLGSAFVVAGSGSRRANRLTIHASARSCSSLSISRMRNLCASIAAIPAAARACEAARLAWRVCSATDGQLIGVRDMSRWHGSGRRRLLSVVCGMICLAVAGSALGAENKFDGAYTGKRTLNKSSSASGCLATEDVSVTIHGDAVTITSGRIQGLALGFYPQPDGSFGELYVDDNGAYHENNVGGGPVLGACA
jgi:hypothetical protein